jgi:hypothetical protein
MPQIIPMSFNVIVRIWQFLSNSQCRFIVNTERQGICYIIEEFITLTKVHVVQDFS